MKLWLLRHGAAEPYQIKDSERKLTEQGRAQVVQAADFLRDVHFDRVLCSPYVRARQTAELLSSTLQCLGVIEIVPWLTPEEDVREVVRKLDSYPVGNLLIVAHQPLLGLLASWLMHGECQYGLSMDTASVACLEGDFIGAGLMDLRALQHVQD
ncbi:phosphohistidine phosphatase SixA [Denitrificimonas sp. JX-1]|uniref:Phosphohistidine phosphatase SixA n=1 Tax=Denitrificimonas halotolerans TaxID=3098930 RepID=A0ABU5GTN8_9GAMM|nr:phosphohistidine phosphatase SixA [Denitrificimonas sp. JX-1]MDY7219601.1 phosphohistidine phosphatase SixA [Denitrificimonas sp. JX-1]